MYTGVDGQREELCDPCWAPVDPLRNIGTRADICSEEMRNWDPG